MAKLAREVQTRFVDLRWRCRDIWDRAIFPPWREALIVRKTRASLPAILGQRAKRLLVDISVIYKHDAGTGIQRVVRSLRDHLPEAVRHDIVIDDAVIHKLREGYVTTSGDELAGGPDSLFFGLDFATDAIHRARKQLFAIRQSGTPMWFLVHDILPMSHPHWFTYPSRLKYRRWMRVCASLADGIICVSPEVARQIEGIFIDRYGRDDTPQIVTITPGSNITATDREVGLTALPKAPGLDDQTFSRAVLIVGTLEPRKGHADALAAFEWLWRQGHDLPLVLIGRPGWNTTILQAAIKLHEQFGRRLFWLDEVSDEQLRAAYRYSRLTLVPSLAEGYGLPLDEALALGSPILARDIPVFRRHGAEWVDYFPHDADSITLAEAILFAASKSNDSRAILTLPDWRSAAKECAAVLACE